MYCNQRSTFFFSFFPFLGSASLLFPSFASVLSYILRRFYPLAFNFAEKVAKQREAKAALFLFSLSSRKVFFFKYLNGGYSCSDCAYLCFFFGLEHHFLFILFPTPCFIPPFFFHSTCSFFFYFLLSVRVTLKSNARRLLRVHTRASFATQSSEHVRISAPLFLFVCAVEGFWAVTLVGLSKKKGNP